MTNQDKLNMAREAYAALGVDVDAAMAKAAEIPVSIHCWQGDDVKGFENAGEELSGGIAATGNHPGAATNPEQLRADISEALSLIPGKKKLSLHACYAETNGKSVPRNELAPKHFASWVDYAKDEKIGLDMNGTFFSHPLAADGFTLSSADPAIRRFWIEHGQVSRKISEYFGRSLGQTSVCNLWIPDGYKDFPADRKAPRARLTEALDEVFKEEIDERYHLDAVESKLFGMGVEAYTTGSSEYYLGYAVTRHKLLTLDAGHFHPTEKISDKISAVLEFLPKILLHVSRPMRWDSDHAVVFDDELQDIAREIVRGDYIDRVCIGLDFFDASINRIAAWGVGARNMQKALLYALLEPIDLLRKAENEGNYGRRLGLLEEIKTLPWGIVWDAYCEQQGVPVGTAWLDEADKYEAKVVAERN